VSAVARFLARWREPRKDIRDPEALRLLLAGGQTKSGTAVGWSTALQVSTVLGAARAIADDLAQCPWKVKRKRDDGGSEDATDHPVYPLLQVQPNEWQTAFELREQIALHVVLAGNAFVLVNRLGRRVDELLPLEPGWVSVKRGTGSQQWRFAYEVRFPGGGSEVLSAADVWHVRGLSWNGYLGLDAVRLAREAIGLAVATEEHGARLFGNGGRPSGLLTTEQQLAPERIDRLRDDWLKSYGGENSGRTAVLMGGLKFQPLTMDSDKAQLLETRRHQVEEICRAMGVFPTRLGFADKTSTYASAEQFFIAHARYTIAPWARRLDQSASVALLGNEPDVYAAHDLNGLMRGTAADRAQFYAAMVANGIMTRNEVRAKEDLNPLAGLDEPLTPLNMGGADPTSQSED